MAYRIVFLSFCTLFFFVMMLATHSVDYLAFLMYSFTFCLGLYIIWRTVWVHARFKLVANQLVVEQPFRDTYSIDLKRLIRWSEHSYNIRGQRRKTVELFFSENRQIKLTNHDLKDEFESLYILLTDKYKFEEYENLTPQEKYIHDVISKLLLTEWDPLGINKKTEARDIYKDYAPQIFNLKRNEADLEMIASHLFEIETKSLGLFGNMNHCRHIANKVISLRYQN